MTEAPTLCSCCKEEIQGKPVHSCGVGLVCRECGEDLRSAALLLQKFRMRGLHLGSCPDYRKEFGK